MAGEVKIKIEVDGSDKAEQQVNSVTKAINGGGNNSLVSSMFQANIASAAFLGGLKLIGEGAEFALNTLEQAAQATFDFAKASLDAASKSQSARITFEVLLGSATKARDLMEKLSDFSLIAPASLEDVQTLAKQLLAVGVNAQDIIPTMKELTNLSIIAGPGSLGNIVNSFSQVKAGTKLTGIQLREFRNNSIPILQILTDYLNKTGGAATTMGTKTKATAAQIKEYGDKLAIAQQKLNEAMNPKVNSKLGKAQTQAKDSTIMSLQNQIENYKQKIADATGATVTLGAKTKVTTADIEDMAGKGEISYDTFKKALDDYVGASGKYGDLIDKQATSWAVLKTNVGDLQYKVEGVVGGMTTGGDLIKGGLLDVMTDQVNAFFTFINDHKDDVNDFAVRLTKAFGSIVGNGANLAKLFAPLVVPISNTYITAIQDVGDFLGNITDHLKELSKNSAIITFFKGLGTTALWVGQVLWNSIVSSFQAAERIFLNVLPSLNDLGSAVGEVGSMFLNLFNSGSVRGVGKDLEDTFTSMLVNLIKDLTMRTKEFIEYLKSPSGQQALLYTKAAIGNLADAVGSLIKWLGDPKNQSAVNTFIDNIHRMIDPVYNLNRTVQDTIASMDKLMGKKTEVVQSHDSGLSGALNTGFLTLLHAGGLFHEGGEIPYVPGGNVPITAQSGEYVIPKRIVDEIKGGNTYTNDNTKNTTINVNVNGGMGRQQANDTGLLFSNLLAKA